MRTLEEEVLDSSYYGTKKRVDSENSYNGWKSTMNRLGKEQEELEHNISILRQEEKMLKQSIKKLKEERKKTSQKDLEEELETTNKLLQISENRNKELLSQAECQEIAITRYKTQAEAYKESNSILSEKLRIETQEKETYKKMNEVEKSNNARLVAILADKQQKNNNPKKVDGTEISLESEYAKTEYIFLLYVSGQLTTEDIAKFIKDGSIKYEIFEEIAFRFDKVDTLELVKKGLK